MYFNVLFEGLKRLKETQAAISSFTSNILKWTTTPYCKADIIQFLFALKLEYTKKQEQESKKMQIWLHKLTGIV